MQIVIVTAPAGKTAMPYGTLTLAVEPDGTVLAPRIAVAELVAAGCALPAKPSADELAAATADPGKLLAAAEEDELAYYLRSRGVQTVTRPRSAETGEKLPVSMNIKDMQTAALAIVAAEAAGPRPIAKAAFLALFTAAEMLAIATAAQSVPAVNVWLITAQAYDMIDLRAKLTSDGLNALVAAGLVTAKRAAAILANQKPV